MIDKALPMHSALADWRNRMVTGSGKADRLRLARTEAGFRSAAAAAAALGVKTPTFTSHENGTRDFGDTEAARYARAFNVAVAWLVFGDTPDDNTRKQESKPPLADQMKRSDPKRKESSRRVFELDVRAGAGSSGVDAFVENVTRNGVTVSKDVVGAEWSIPTDYLNGELRIRSGTAWIIEVFGDSGYEPANPGAPGSLFPGDRVIIDTSDTRPSPPGAFAVHDGVGLVIKQVEVIARSEPVRLRLTSRNPTYSPYEVTVEEARIIGRVRGRISSM
jgi:phage repressor protein C with HTH and peptisase S24 domain